MALYPLSHGRLQHVAEVRAHVARLLDAELVLAHHARLRHHPRPAAWPAPRTRLASPTLRTAATATAATAAIAATLATAATAATLAPVAPAAVAVGGELAAVERLAVEEHEGAGPG